MTIGRDNSEINYGKQQYLTWLKYDSISYLLHDNKELVYYALLGCGGKPKQYEHSSIGGWSFCFQVKLIKYSLNIFPLVVSLGTLCT